jgi:hypothetical protein
VPEITKAQSPWGDVFMQIAAMPFRSETAFSALKWGISPWAVKLSSKCLRKLEFTGK